MLKQIAVNTPPIMAAFSKGKMETNLPPILIITVLYPAAGSKRSVGKLYLSASARKSAPSSAYILRNMNGNRIDQTESNMPKNTSTLSQKYFLKTEINFEIAA